MSLKEETQNALYEVAKKFGRGAALQRLFVMQKAGKIDNQTYLEAVKFCLKLALVVENKQS